MTRRRLPLLAVWTLFAALAAAAVALGPSLRAPGEGPRPLSAVPFAAIGAAEAVSAGAWHRFERGADGLWFRHDHAAGGADAAHAHAVDPETSAAIARALEAFASAPVRAEPGAARDPERYGVSAPRFFVVLYRAGDDRPLARYAIGRETRGGRYIGVRRGMGAAVSVVTAPEEPIAALRALLAPAPGAAGAPPARAPKARSAPKRRFRGNGGMGHRRRGALYPPSSAGKSGRASR